MRCQRRPGQCRFLFSILYPKYDMPWALRAMMAIMPRFHKHLAFTAKVLDGDSSILHAQVTAPPHSLP